MQSVCCCLVLSSTTQAFSDSLWQGLWPPSAKFWQGCPLCLGHMAELFAHEGADPFEPLEACYRGEPPSPQQPCQALMQNAGLQGPASQTAEEGYSLIRAATKTVSVLQALTKGVSHIHPAFVSGESRAKCHDWKHCCLRQVMLFRSMRLI